MPDRFLMEGVSEANVVGVAAGLAFEGKIVYVNTIATFLTRRCFEQVVLDLEPFADKWRAFGFAVEEVDGHSVEQLRAALKRVPFDSEKPSAILCHTIKGKGASFVENNLNWHHKNKVTPEEIQSLLAELEDKT
jgi:deoxyxylulose-5-phosphate synthase